MTQAHFNRSNLAKVMTYDEYQIIEQAYVRYHASRSTNYPVGYLVPVKNVITGTRPSNTIENAIVMYGKWSGEYFAENIKNQGTYRKGIGFTPGRGTRGTADLSVTFPGNRNVKVEVKYGRDVQSDDQKLYQEQIEAVGGEYWIVRSFTEFNNSRSKPQFPKDRISKHN